MDILVVQRGLVKLFSDEAEFARFVMTLTFRKQGDRVVAQVDQLMHSDALKATSTCRPARGCSPATCAAARGTPR